MLRSAMAGPSRPANFARTLHATATAQVKRPQKPFDMHLPPDPMRDGPKSLDKRTAGAMAKLHKIENSTSKTEKYAKSFGLKGEDSEVLNSAHRFRKIVEKFKSGETFYAHDGRRAADGESRERRAWNTSRDSERRPRDDRPPRDSGRPRDFTPRGVDSSAPRRPGGSKGSFGLKAGMGNARSPPREARPPPQRSHDGPKRWDDRSPRSRDRPPHSPPTDEAAPPEEKRPWEPTKKLTFAAMAAVRELHAQDPEQWTRAALSEQFRVSEEAVRRILRSNYRLADKLEAAPRASGKWDLDPEGEAASAVPTIKRVYALKREAEKGVEP